MKRFGILRDIEMRMLVTNSCLLIEIVRPFNSCSSIGIHGGRGARVCAEANRPSCRRRPQVRWPGRYWRRPRFQPAARGRATWPRSSDRCLRSRPRRARRPGRRVTRCAHASASVERALMRIEKGTYGQCVRCEAEIASKRLEARPEAALCFECASQEQR
jgi:DksA/TraR C4-type zinc finger protein